MSKPWIPIVLAILMALQAVAVAADTHRFHAQTDQHLILSDLHTGSLDDSASDPSHHAADSCQHCCHCHGSFHALVSSCRPELATLSSAVISSVPERLVSQPAPALYRPPKA